MKKKYIKPEMQVHQILHRGMLLSSGKGVYGKIDGVEDATGLKYAGYIEEENEEEIDPD